MTVDNPYVPPTLPAQHYVVSPDNHGVRLDTYLATIGAASSRAQLKCHIEDGRVVVDDKVITKAGFKLLTGQRVTHTPPPLSPVDVQPEAIPLDIRFEDPWLLVVHKPAGMVVHPAPGHRTGTLVNALLHHCPNLPGIGAVQRPGIVHRLDKDTSGLLVVAKTDDAHHGLVRQFKSRSLTRRYIAVVLGTGLAPHGEFSTVYGRHPHDRRRFTTRIAEGRPAITQYHVLAESKLCTLVEISLKTGRTHQIRVHFSEVGKPIVADTLYGSSTVHGSGVGTASQEAAAIRKMPRQALHAGILGFVHPISGEPLLCVAQLPDDLAYLTESVFGTPALTAANSALTKWWTSEPK